MLRCNQCEDNGLLRSGKIDRGKVMETEIKSERDMGEPECWRKKERKIKGKSQGELTEEGGSNLKREGREMGH